MKHLLIPDAWRSEAFAEDLFEDARRRAGGRSSSPRRPSPLPQLGALASSLLGLAPVLLGVIGVLMVVWGGPV